jgi:hypothetical protein
LLEAEPYVRDLLRHAGGARNREGRVAGVIAWARTIGDIDLVATAETPRM